MMNNMNGIFYRIDGGRMNFFTAVAQGPQIKIYKYNLKIPNRTIL